MSHKQFNRDSRIQLGTLLSVGYTQKKAGEKLGIDRSNVNKEVSRNKDEGEVYRGASAHRRYLRRRKESKKKFGKIRNNKKLERHTIGRIKKYWSPEQIAGRLKKKGTTISHETIYKFIYEERPDLVKFLRHQKNKYRRRRGSHARMRLNKASKVRIIDERPIAVEDRVRIGDWEDDTIVGKERTKKIWTCVERKSGYGMAEKLEVVSAEIMNQMNVSVFKSIPRNKRLTLTRDNGPEFGDYDRDLERKTGLEVYRAHPYHSWERGSNENWNGLLRQFFPSGSYFANVKQTDVERAVKLLNTRPRKRLGYATPAEVFNQCGDSD